MSEIARIGRVSVEELRIRIDSLVCQRQELRAAGASADRLESNRRQLVRTQWALCSALIARYGKKAA
jgi:hypothetical protein